MSSRPAALPFFRQLIAASSSSSVNCHVDSVSPHCLFPLLWRVLCGGFPFIEAADEQPGLLWHWSAVWPFWGHCWSFWWLTRLAYCCESYQHSQWDLARTSFGLLRLLPWASPLHSWCPLRRDLPHITLYMSRIVRHYQVRCQVCSVPCIRVGCTSWRFPGLSWQTGHSLTGLVPSPVELDPG